MIDDAWVTSADRALARAADQIKPIRASTPKNFDSELAALGRAFRRGTPRLPAWEYEPRNLRPELCLALEKLAEFLEAQSALGKVYAARARELCLEASLIQAVGTPRIRLLARQRFLGDSEEDTADLRAAEALATQWTEPSRAPADDRGALVRSCDLGDPHSLVSVMSREAGRAKLPVRVVVQAGLASLAATADGAILVAPNQWLGQRDVERTVLHEIAGHALPHTRASSAPLGIFAIGTARGIDDQEGRALLIEESAGYLDEGRRRELGLRHLAALHTLEGATLVEVVERLVGRGATIDVAVRIAARVQRGGWATGGLSREIVYLPAFLRVGRATHSRSRAAAIIEHAMASGRIAANVAHVVAPALSAIREPIEARAVF